MQYSNRKRFIAFPVCNNAPLTRMRLVAGEMTWVFDVELVAPEQAMFWVYFDTQFCNDDPIVLTSSTGIDEDIWCRWVLFDDHFPDFERLYQEPHRPLYHFSSSRGWINDPNGLVKKDGRFHMFYQSNPFGCRGFDKGWGHCVSDNLFDWEILPPALSADDNGYAISGCTLFDTEGCAGFGKASWIMAYSSRTHLQSQLGQHQNIASSTDGCSFAKYSGNPVISDNSCLDFRDPKVFWHAQTSCYVMLVTFGQKLRFYRSDNLLDWSLLSIVEDSTINPDHKIYECPDLLCYAITGEEHDIWVLSISFIDDRSVQFIFGEFDGVTFHHDPTIPLQRADFGRDFYAAVAWNPYGEMEGRKLWIAWMCYWPYVDQLPKGEGWLSLFTVPRELVLKRNCNGIPVICQQPAAELGQLVTNLQQYPNKHLYVGDSFVQSLPAACRISGTLQASLHATIELQLKYTDEQVVVLTLDATKSRLIVDRSRCNATRIGNDYDTPQEMPLNNPANADFVLLVDRNCLEIYFDSGEHCMSLLCPSTAHEPTLNIKSHSGDCLLQGLRVETIRQATWKV